MEKRDGDGAAAATGRLKAVRAGTKQSSNDEKTGQSVSERNQETETQSC